MELNHYIYMAITAIINTLLGFFILTKILKTIANKNKKFTAIYFFILFSIIMFLVFFFIDFKHNRIPFEFQEFIKKMFFMLIDSMLFSLAICLFFSFIIFITYIFEKK